jgi:hypothetical protein
VPGCWGVSAWLLGRYLEYSTEKARTKLGWVPALSYRESIDRTVRWFLDDEPARVPHDRIPLLVVFWNGLDKLTMGRGVAASLPAAASSPAVRREAGFEMAQEPRRLAD